MFGKNCIRANLRFTAANVDEIADCPVRVGRLHLKGLVGFRISNGTTILNAAVSSDDEKSGCRLWIDDKERRSILQIRIGWRFACWETTES